jgi:hypothetical protein
MLIAKESRPDEETGPGLSCAKMQFAESISENKGNNKITELRTILQRESQNS